MYQSFARRVNRDLAGVIREKATGFMVVGLRCETLHGGRKSGGQTGLTSKRDTKKLMPMKVTASKYDVADHLRTPEEITAYVEVSFEEANGDAAFIAKALGNIA